MGIMSDIKTTFNPDIAVWKSTGPGCITSYLQKHNIITIPESHTLYDIKSNDLNISVYPFYYVNFMKDIMQIARNRKINAADILKIGKKDIKYAKYNEICKTKVYAIQLWMGGKKQRYQRKLNIPLIMSNIQLYTNYIIKSGERI